MHKPWLRAEDAWTGEREPGGYLHGPWPKFWVEPERREEFVSTSDARRMAWAWRRYTETGLARRPRRWARSATTSCATRTSCVSRSTRASASSTSSASTRKRSRDTFLSATMRADDSSVGTWRSTFYPSELAEIDAEAGDLLRQLGYDD